MWKNVGMFHETGQDALSEVAKKAAVVLPSKLSAKMDGHKW